MTDEEALELAKLAWPETERLSAHVRDDGVSYVYAHCAEANLVAHRNRARFEQALRVLAGVVGHG